MRCRAEAPPAPPPVAALARLSLFFSTFSQRASFPRRIGRRREIARQSPAGGVCGRTTNSTQTYLTETRSCNTAAVVCCTLMHSRRPACSFVCSYADVPVATGRWRGWPAIAKGC